MSSLPLLRLQNYNFIQTKISNELIMQWFKFEHGANISSFTYPIAFKRFCLVVSSTKSGEYNGTGYDMSAYEDYDLTSLVRVYEDYKQDYLIFGT